MGKQRMFAPDNCRLTRYPDPLLGRPAQTIEQIDDNIRSIADKMIDIMLENKGVGLAGPQAGVPLRIFVISLDGTKENAKAYINPTLAPAGNPLIMEEGCLSLPGIYVKIRRYDKCVLTAVGLDGKEVTQEAEGLQAKAFQHECDHLNGTLIIDRIGQLAKLAVRKRLNELTIIYEENQKNRQTPDY